MSGGDTFPLQGNSGKILGMVGILTIIFILLQSLLGSSIKSKWVRGLCVRLRFTRSGI